MTDTNAAFQRITVFGLIAEYLQSALGLCHLQACLAVNANTGRKNAEQKQLL